MVDALGGEVIRSDKREYGFAELNVRKEGGGVLAGVEKKTRCWMSHGDRIGRLPKGFRITASTENTEAAAAEDAKRRLYGLQFHPEVVHTAEGKKMLENFLFGVCRCAKSWTMKVLRPRRRRGDPGDGRRQTGDPRSFRGGRFLRRGRPAPPGDRPPAHLRLRGQRPAAAGRGGEGPGPLREKFPDERPFRAGAEGVCRRPQGGDGSGTETEDHRPDLHRGLRQGGQERSRGRSSSPRGRSTRI